ncbi:MAG: hypothetical protein ACTSRW_16140, partial [Candidatus Helarchaeota archaeon]
VSVYCRMVETYRTVFIGNDTEGPQQTESKTDWPFKKAVNFTIYYNNTDNPNENTVLGSYIEVAGEDEYANPSSYEIMGWDGTSFALQNNSLNGVFKIAPNTSLATNNKAYIFNITLFHSNDADEPYKNQTFQIVFGCVKPLTTIIYETYPSSYIPWGTNVTLVAQYQNIQADNDPITGATINISVASIIEDGESVLTKYGYSTIDEYLAAQGWSVDNNVTIEEWTAQKKYNITFDTTWTNNSQWMVYIHAQHSDYSSYSIALSFYIRDVLCSLDQPVGMNLYYLDELPLDQNGNKHFNLSVVLRDLDNNSIPIANDSGLEKYAGINFYYYDSIGGHESVNRWGRYDSIINGTNWYGNFTVFYDPVSGTYNMTFTVKDGMPETYNYIMTLRVNGTHMRGPTLADEWASNTFMITIKLKLHITGVTANKTEKHPTFDELLVPQVNEFWVWDGSEVSITYGEDFNFTIFYYDMNSSHFLTLGEANQSGVEDSPYWNVTTDTVFGRASGNETFPADMRRYIYFHDYYHDISYPTFHNPNYLGIFNFELRTSLLHLVEQNEADLVNGGKNNDGRYNITINLWFTGEGFQKEYKLSTLTIPIRILPINTTLALHEVVLQGGTSNGLSLWVPFGTPGSNYYFDTKLNFSYAESGVGYNVNDSIDFADGYSFEIWTGSSWESWQSGLSQYTPGSPQQRLRIYTETIHTVDNVLFPWNASGDKLFPVRLNFSKTNYENASLNFNIVLHKHYTALVPVDENFNPLWNRMTNWTLSTRYRNNDYKIYFIYFDFEENEPIYLAEGEGSCDWHDSVISTHDIYSHIYVLSLLPDATVSGSPYIINVTMDDPHSLQYRNVTTSRWNLTIEKANIEFTSETRVLLPQIYQLVQQVDLVGVIQDEWGNSLSGTVTIEIRDSSTQAVVYTQQATFSNGRLNLQVLSAFVGFGQFEITLTAESDDPNYNTQSKTLTITINPIWTHPLFIISMIAVGAVAGFVAYREVKWLLTPYVVKQMIKTRKAIRKGKDLKQGSVVRTRSKLFMDEFKEEWAYLNLKAPEMVSNEIVELARQLSDIKRMRVTTAEAKQLMTQLQQMGLTQADAYLESTMMIPPDARRQILTTVGLIKEEKPEILSFRELISEIKAEEHTYDEAEDLYNKLKSMKIVDADNYLWKVELIPAEDRIRLLDQVGFAVEKLRKKRKKAMPPLTVRELKSELKTIPGLSLEDRRELIERLKNMTFKDQKKRLDEIKSQRTKTIPKKEEPKKVEPEPKKEDKKPKLARLTPEEIERELSQIKGLSDEDKNLLKDSISILSPEEQRKTIENLRKQYSSNS